VSSRRYSHSFDHYFRTDDLKDNLRRRSVHGAAFTVTSIGIKFAINAGATMILARLLTPQDFGLVAMVVSVTGLVTIFRDLGLATATVQSPSLDHSLVNTLFWLNVFFGISMGLLTAVFSPLFSWFFREPRVTSLGVVLGGVMMIEGFSIQHQALLRRRMKFGALAVSEILSVAAGAAVALFFAWRGAGYWSLVWMKVAAAIAGVASLWLLCTWRPSATLRLGEARSLVKFGGQITAARFVRYISRNLDRLLVGRSLGPQTLGFYAKASGWLVAPFQQLTWPVARVAIPVLSRLQDEPRRFRTYYQAGLSILALLGIPAIIYLVLDAPAVILLILGDQWLEAIPIFRVLAPVAVAALFQIGFQWCYVSLGRADRQLVWEITNTIVTLIALFMGLRWGVLGVASAYSVASILLLPIGAAYCFRHAPVGPRDLLSVFVRPGAAAIGAGILLFLFQRMMPIGNLPAAVALHALLFASAYILFWLISPGGRQAAADLLRLGRDLQKFKRSPA
jgi:O-antigen/teichoic acid export membrane protein